MAATEVYSILADKLGKSKVTSPKPGELKYFTAQSAALVPAVQAFPENAKDVSTMVQTARDHQVPFAVKAGGHGVYAGASSIQGGILIDLSRINKVEVAPDRQSVFIGAGAKWGDVYGKLDALGISVPGGRISTVGVGGLTLGGGISFAASRFGLACDNVKSYEIVLADGTIVSATRATHPDLFWALRGAGTNFGVVTTFEFVVFEQGPIWGGVKQYLEDSEAQAIALLDKFCKSQGPASSSADVYAEAFIITAYVAPMGKFITTAVLSHGKPGSDDPSVFDGFKALPSIASTTKVRSIADLSVELNANNPHGLRSKTLALAVKSDMAILSDVMEIYKDVIRPHKDTVKNFVPAILLQPMLPRMLPADESEHTLGISKHDGPLFVISLLWSWTEPSDDELIEGLARAFTQRVTSTAKAQDNFHRYVYLNYAAGDQDVFASYGEENLARLLQVSKKYDADGTFSKLRPGYISVARSGQGKSSG
ncbi:uncharacterized protein Z520_08266 [Fonsecaea multimorphosa CBS 102226]|uniref:FAD-binding PCMH-type domain-containing protein n=1 Tax=Fonsecaea multimorphosa CBS 102226 TaxID=1442371 RepID=A0A0D2IG25_9EURO|nr:uncharacterized protein Z520_08266 [Fonsecaea multimorphosa CBS 102226]KIX96011.1 hypothetical protein Z520_08266 [Fonsecaea multimorphosa CBS 102226]OAL21780.1 hypothetical protein AYO22_07722 [Fonsecaea multimorphosa]